MSATGWRYANWTQGGSVPGRFGTAAGDVFTVLDYMLTQGSNPWTKTNTGTNQNSYQAPGGSQATFEVTDNLAMATSNWARVVATIGGDRVPTLTQESAYCVPRIVKGVNTSGPFGWWSVRTDRFFMLISTNPTSSSVSHMMFAIGDVPTLTPGDPGVCIVLSAPLTSVANSISFINNYGGLAPSQQPQACGVMHTSKDTLLLSPRMYSFTTCGTNAGGSSTLAMQDTDFPVWPWYLGDNNDPNTNSFSKFIFRARLPYYYCFTAAYSSEVAAIGGSTSVGDTFSIGGATYEAIYLGATTGIGALMVTDHEDLP